MRKFTLLAVLAVLSLFLAVLAGGSGAAGGPEQALGEWQEALARQADLGERERQLVAELLAWDAKIEAGHREQERLRREIPGVERSLAAAREGLADSRARQEEGLKRLGRWVNFLYRYGPVSYLEVILAAADFNDFVERAGAVKIVLDNQVSMLAELRALDASLREQVANLGRTQEELAAKSSRLAVSLREMEESRAGREEFLAGLKGQSAELAQKIVRVETILWRSLDSLHYLLAGLDRLPWYSLEPDNMTIAGKRLRLEFSDQRVNKLFFEQGDPALAGLAVRSTPGLFTIAGQARAGEADFVLAGNFVPDGRGQVRFQLERVTLAGVPVSPEVLNYITSENSLAMGYESYLPGYGLAEVSSEEGRLVVYLITGARH